MRRKSPQGPLKADDVMKLDSLDKKGSQDIGDIGHDRLVELERTCVRKLDLVIAPLIGAFNFLV